MKLTIIIDLSALTIDGNTRRHQVAQILEQYAADLQDKAPLKDLELRDPYNNIVGHATVTKDAAP